MKKSVKKAAICLMSGMLITQPTAEIVINDSVIVAEAHSERTDSSGGHKDNKNKSGLGSYHYHCGGNPPHLHSGGVCPYSSTAASSSVSSGSDSETGTASPSNTAAASASGISISGKSLDLSSGESISVSKDLIKIVQDVLKQKGYECGTADGIIGAKTREAIEEFLKDSKNSDDTDHLIISMIAEGVGIE